MNGSVRDCLVMGFEPLIEGLKLPGMDDRHVLAAAIQAGAQVIVTNNRKDFPPPDYLANWGVERRTADEFMMDLMGLDDRVVHACVQETATSRRRPPQTFDDVVGQLERSGLTESVAAPRLGPGAVNQRTQGAGRRRSARGRSAGLLPGGCPLRIVVAA